MNIRITLIINFILCLFPYWLIGSNIQLNIYIFLTYIFFFLLCMFVKNVNTKSNIFLSSCIITYGLDQQLLSNLIFIKPYFYFILNYLTNVYLADLAIILIYFLLCFFLISKIKINAVKIINIVLLSLILSNIFLLNNNDKYVQNFESQKNFNLNNKDKKLIIIFDEMSGLNSTENKFQFGAEFTENVINFSKKYKFQVFANAYSLGSNTATVIPSLLNFVDSSNELAANRHISIEKSLNFFNEYNINKNNLFDNYQEVAVLQNIHLNYCLHKNVKSCFQFDVRKLPLQSESGFKNNYLTYFLSNWKYQGSSIAKIAWRLGRELNISDSILEPEAHKIFLQYFFFKIEKYLSQNHDLVFAHLLVPHIPYGYDQNCNYNGQKSINNYKMSYKQKMIQHNLERKCLIKKLELFLSDLEKKEYFKFLEIIIMSDHGSRISPKEDFSTIYLKKEKNNNFFINEKKNSIQALFKNDLMK